jgi:dihydroneopterin aldolase
VYEFERQTARDIVAQITLGTNLRPAAISDKLCDTVDYATLCESITKFTESSNFELIESLAEGIASLCLQNSGVNWVQVEVAKPGAIPNARTVSVQIARSRL